MACQCHSSHKTLPALLLLSPKASLPGSPLLASFRFGACLPSFLDVQLNSSSSTRLLDWTRLIFSPKNSHWVSFFLFLSPVSLIVRIQFALGFSSCFFVKSPCWKKTFIGVQCYRHSHRKLWTFQKNQ